MKRVAEEVGPERRVLSLQDGNCATQYFLQGLPEKVSVVGQTPKNGSLYERPGPQPEDTPGPDPEKGDEIGFPEEGAESELEWAPHQTEEYAEVYSFGAIWQSVLLGEVLRVVMRSLWPDRSIFSRPPPRPPRSNFRRSPLLRPEGDGLQQDGGGTAKWVEEDLE